MPIVSPSRHWRPGTSATLRGFGRPSVPPSRHGHRSWSKREHGPKRSASCGSSSTRTATTPFARSCRPRSIARTSKDGRRPRVSSPLHLGPRLPNADQLKGKVVLLFFWAHWCVQCRADGPIVERLVSKYRGQGLAIVAPTQRYGYVEGGRPAAPASELRHIAHVRDTHYRFLRNEPVPIDEANYKEYGVTTIPMYVLLDRQGIVRLYHAGRMTAEELEAAIREPVRCGSLTTSVWRAPRRSWPSSRSPAWGTTSSDMRCPDSEPALDPAARRTPR